MENEPLHDEFRSELVRRGLPRAYIERLLSELDDHYTDLLEERSTSMGAARKLQTEIGNDGSSNAEQRLGNPAQLALFAAERYHARSFWGRHPWITYLLAPLPLLATCWIAFGTAFWAFMWCICLVGVHVFGWTDDTFANPGDYIWLQAGSIAFMCWYAIVLPPLTAAWLLCRTYRRNALDWRWPIVGCILLAAVAGVFTTSYRIATEPNNGLFMIGFDVVGTSTDWLLRFLPKFALALGIGLLLIKRAQRQLELEP
jgi:hypothetical protein